MKITKSELRRIIQEEKQKLLAERRIRSTVRNVLREGTIGLDTKAEVMTAIEGQDIEISMGGMGPVIIVKGGPTYTVDNAFEPMMAEFDYDGSALVRALETAARSVHVDDDLKEELGIFDE
ncbi:MAG: hypothetical protein VXW76_03485 [Actinomycetota bacterium]|nr:hypothetical protein [Actinomycetota bacterium]